MQNLPVSMFINGQFVSNDSNPKVDVLNPATLELVERVESASKEDVLKAIESASAAFRDWKNIGGLARAEYLKKIGARIVETADEYAKILSLENGKSLAEAKGEILYGAAYFEVYAGEAQRIHGEILSSAPGMKIEVTKEPVGVVGAITPWNFPQAMLARKMAAALAAGCTLVAKPDIQTPFSSLLLGKVCEDVGLPKGVVNILTGDPVVIGKTMMDSSDIKKISFTGSTRVGKLLIEQSASSVKKLSLELGGNAPFIVFDDADLDKAVAGAMASKYRNAGQTCVCTNRFLVHESVMEAFMKKFAEKLKAFKVGSASDPESKIGPLINKQAKAKVESLIEDAEASGAKITTVGELPNLPGNFVLPTLVEAPNTEVKVFSEEIFGPVSVFYPFKTEEEAIELANSTEYGLASYFFSESLSRIERVRSQLDYGMLGINCGRVSSPWAPFGGVKESGFGREGGHSGIKEYQYEKMSMLTL